MQERKIRLAWLAIVAAAAGCAVVGDDESVEDATSALDGEVTIFRATDVPEIVSDSDNQAVELGIRFRADVSGAISGLRFYKSRQNRGTHVGHLWSNSGTMLGQLTFTNETRTGWQTARFATPVVIQAGVTYVASYYAPVGRYSATNDAFASAGLDRPPLHALRDGQDGPNGVYRYGASAFPTSTWHSSNYFVDVLFKPGGTSTVDAGAGTDAGTGTDSGGTDSGATDAGTAPDTSVPPGSCVGAKDAPGGPDGKGGCWPGPQNTGYPHGLPGDARTPVTLTTYTGPLTISTCGVVIDSKVINGDLLITAGNGTHSPNTPCVTIKNSLVKGSVHTDNTNQGPLVMMDTEVAVPGSEWWASVGFHNTFTWRVNSHGGHGTIKCQDYCETYDSWIHGMYLEKAYHYNAIGSNGLVSNGYWKIVHNYMNCGDFAGKSSDVQSDAGCSADLGFYGDFGPIINITVTRNYFAPANPTAMYGSGTQPGYCFQTNNHSGGKPYMGATNLVVTDNVFARGPTGKCGTYGPHSGWTTGNGNVWSGNTWDDGSVLNP